MRCGVVGDVAGLTHGACVSQQGRVSVGWVKRGWGGCEG